MAQQEHAKGSKLHAPTLALDAREGLKVALRHPLRVTRVSDGHKQRQHCADKADQGQGNGRFRHRFHVRVHATRVGFSAGSRDWAAVVVVVVLFAAVGVVAGGFRFCVRLCRLR